MSTLKAQLALALVDPPAGVPVGAMTDVVLDAFTVVVRFLVVLLVDVLT